jgi:hypothetical protein
MNGMKESTDFVQMAALVTAEFRGTVCSTRSSDADRVVE